MKEYVFLHNLENEGIKAGGIKDLSPELTIAMFYQSSRADISLIMDSKTCHCIRINSSRRDSNSLEWSQ
jgi:hypothetical protein